MLVAVVPVEKILLVLNRWIVPTLKPVSVTDVPEASAIARVPVPPIMMALVVTALADASVKVATSLGVAILKRLYPTLMVGAAL